MSDLLEYIGWENTIKVWHLAVLFMLMILGFLWEIRKQKPRKSWRMIALLLVFISLYTIYLSPYYLIKKPLASVLLISQETSKNEVDSLSKLYDLPILIQQENSKFNKIDGAKLATLDQLEYQIDTAFVFGYFPQLNPANFQFRKDIVIETGIHIDYPKSIPMGDSLRILIDNRENREINISAIVGNDSISKTIEASGKTSISILPKSPGFALAEINTETEAYNFAVKVEDTENYVIQILAAAPDFEWKFLGDYLKSNGHSIYQKTQISKGKFKSSFLNWHDTLQFNNGVANNLKVLFTDVNAWNDLAVNVKNQFLNKLKENKGSLIFRTNPSSSISLDFSNSGSKKIFSTGDNLLDHKNFKYLNFNNLYKLDEVGKNSIFRKVSADIIYGVLNFQNSYQLQLSGRNNEYELIWDPIFSQLIRNSTDFYYDKSKWAVQHQPFFFRFWSAESYNEISIFNLQQDTFKLKSKTDFLYPERKHFMFYAKQSGWHFIKFENQSEPIPFYVHSESLAEQSEFLINYNRDYLNYRNFTDSTIQQMEMKYNQKSITIWIFMLFLFSVGYLWIEDKIT